MLHIVTPLSRPEFLEKVKDSVFSTIPADRKHEIVWWVIVDAALTAKFSEIKEIEKNNPQIAVRLSSYEKPIAGHLHRNWFLEHYQNCYQHVGENAWVYFLDDDTLLHPDFYEEFFINAYPETAALIFHQHWPNGNIRLTADLTKVKVCHIDMGQYALNLKYVAPYMRFENNYCGDGIFIEMFFAKHGHRFAKIDKFLSTYNALRP